MKITLTPINIRVEALQQKLIIYTSGCITGAGGGAVDSVNGKTGVVVLDTADIAEGTDANYVSDAEKTVIGNTSGMNTGDQVGDGSTITGTGTAADPFVSVGGGTSDTSQILTAGAGITINVTLGNIIFLTLTEDCLIGLPANLTALTKVKFYITTNGFNATWNAAFIPSAPELSATGVDMVEYYSISTTILSLQNAIQATGL